MCYGNYGGFVSPYRRGASPMGPLNHTAINSKIYGTGAAKKAQAPDTVEISGKKQKMDKKTKVKLALAAIGIAIVTTIAAYKGHAKLQTGAKFAAEKGSQIANCAKEHAPNIYRTGHGVHDVIGGITGAVAAPFNAVAKCFAKK